MIEETFTIHDRYSIEIKLGYKVRRKLPISEFACNTWIFIPASLDINQTTYQKADFYRDLKSNIRLITPVFLLRDIANASALPFAMLEKSFADLASMPTRTKSARYEYQIRMFMSILKSAIRNEINHIINHEVNEDTGYLINEYVRNLQVISDNYRNLRRIINAPTITKDMMNYYLFGDEFMSNIIEQHTFRLVSRLEVQPNINTEWIGQLMNLIHHEIAYKKEKKYQVIDRNDPNRNRELVFRFGLLKKYAENELFLQADTRKDGAIAEQVYYSLAAGLSMIFATAVAFSFQIKYGNLTIPFFVALVVSYMLKDRIKELTRYWFAHKLSRRHFDHKTRISLNQLEIGWSKEAMDFIPESKVPAEVMRIRDRSAILEAHNRSHSEKIILFRKLVRINRENLDKSSTFDVNGINEIIRFNFSGFITKMDDPVVPLFVPGQDKPYDIIKGEKIYYVNFIIQLRSGESTQYKRYRIILNRKGIRGVETFN